MSIFLTWGNARGKFPHPFFRLWMAHISTISVHDELKSGKNVRPGSWPFPSSLISAVESHARRGTFLLPSSASASSFCLPVFCPALPVGSPLRAVLAVSAASCVPLGSVIGLVPPRPGSLLPFRARQPAVGPPGRECYNLRHAAAHTARTANDKCLKRWFHGASFRFDCGHGVCP